LSPTTTTDGPGFQTGDAAEAASGGTTGFAIGVDGAFRPATGAGAAAGAAVSAGFCSLLPHPHTIATMTTRRIMPRSYHIASLDAQRDRLAAHDDALAITGADQAVTRSANGHGR
jgi:hypothetical protein